MREKVSSSVIRRLVRAHFELAGSTSFVSSKSLIQHTAESTLTLRGDLLISRGDMPSR